MTSFFYVLSIAFHTSVPPFRKCMDTSRKKFFWLTVQPLVHRLLHLFNGPERLPSHCLFERSKDMTVTGGGARSGEYGECRRHSKDTSWVVATAEWVVWGWALSYWSKTPVIRRPCCLDLIAGHRWFFRRYAYVALVTVFSLGMQCSKITPRSFQNRVSITLPADDYVWNFFGFGEEVWHLSMFAVLVSGWW